MSDNLKTLNHPESAENEKAAAALKQEAREAVLRLRKLGERLPPVDAVAIIREGRQD